MLLIGCDDNNADDGKHPSETTAASDIIYSDTTTIAPETTTAITTIPVTTEPVTTAPVTSAQTTTSQVTTEPTPTVTTEPWVVTEPAGDGWSDFH